ncbi:methylated-DNA--[protein]-cysteine S-methyltransferase [Streptomyces sp. SP18CS02]|uniref:methylated-DNA--[protein]-cysteine S-methyltransferase n=1 Tax=Streptomyces sp. SP18CS02 TaxID=3002531 RepID=UPI002E76324F|nr:methylated-DNA--[protein]-cysteine S-methyltransferase [Streptomyces sp. SP18CS02]MEE1751769.1 methylated-DNA--[protein]-cysteine S-methyltransferase [Streptomyces sp. SP18CS02]
MTVYAYVDGPLGEMLLVGEEATQDRPAREGPARADGLPRAAGTEGGPASGGGTRGATVLVSLSLPGQKGGAVVQDGWRRAPEAFEAIAAQLRAYFAGELTRFDIACAEGGTDFQRRVWRALEDIPYGATVSYGDIAARIGTPGAGVRAVGTAIGRNPLLVVRPCHRVIGADGALRGYAGGLESKQRLLGLEGALAS